jgi:hypothetical protein
VQLALLSLLLVVLHVAVVMCDFHGLCSYIRNSSMARASLWVSAFTWPIQYLAVLTLQARCA